MTAETFQAPDYELRKVILTVIKKHPRPGFSKIDDVRVGCLCGWQYVKGEGPKATSNQERFRKHQAWAIETAVTAFLDAEEEQEQAA